VAKPTAAFVCNNPINISVTGVSPTSRSHQDLVACIEVLTTEKLSLFADLSCAIKEISRMNAELTTALSMENESSAGAFEELQILLVKQSSIMERRLKNISNLAAAEEALKIFERSEAQPQIFATNLADITGTSLFFGHITVHFLVHLLSFTTYDPSQFLVDVCCLFLNGFNNNCLSDIACTLWFWYGRGFFGFTVLSVQPGTLRSANFLVVPNAIIQLALQEGRKTIGEVNSMAVNCMLKPLNIENRDDVEELRQNPRQR
jgi:hypothetical protein